VDREPIIVSWAIPSEHHSSETPINVVVNLTTNDSPEPINLTMNNRSEPIDSRDVKNLMRHMYLIGINDGIIWQRRKAPKSEDPVDENFREEAIEDFISGQIQDGYTPYGRDLGSQGHCPPDCDI
jgi:hypothetical protein